MGVKQIFVSPQDPCSFRHGVLTAASNSPTFGASVADSRASTAAHIRNLRLDDFTPFQSAAALGLKH